MTFLC